MLIGFASSGKTAVGKVLAQARGCAFVDLDEKMESLFRESAGGSFTCREIFKSEGEVFFRELEARAVKEFRVPKPYVLSTGGGVILTPANIPILKGLGKILFLKASPEALLERMGRKGLPAYLDANRPLESLVKVLSVREYLYKKIADVTIDTTGLSARKVAEKISTLIKG